MKKGSYASVKLCSFPSAYLTAMLEPTLVVAIAAASARLGAGMETKLADAMLAAAADSAVKRKLAPPASEVASGSNGAPAMTFRASRRDVSTARVMAFGSSRNAARTDVMSAAQTTGIAADTGNPRRTVGPARDTAVKVR